MMANVSKLSYDMIEQAFGRFNGELTFEKYGKHVRLRVDKTAALFRPAHTQGRVALEFVDGITFA